MTTPGHYGNTAPRATTMAALQAIAQCGSVTPDYLALQLNEGIAAMRQRLRGMAKRGLLKSWMHETHRTHAYGLTAEGTAILKAHQAENPSTTPAPAGQRATPRQPVDMRATTYDGAELRPYSGRPGAMRAYALPSRMGERLLWPRGDKA